LWQKLNTSWENQALPVRINRLNSELQRAKHNLWEVAAWELDTWEGALGKYL